MEAFLFFYGNLFPGQYLISYGEEYNKRQNRMQLLILLAVSLKEDGNICCHMQTQVPLKKNMKKFNERHGGKTMGSGHLS